MLQLVRIEAALPDGFAALAAEARAEGHRNMDRLAVEFAARPSPFTALLAAFDGAELVGVGGLTPEPAAPAGEAWRMRRLYVLKSARRRGVATALANALLSEALSLGGLATVHAGSEEAARFWEALDFRPAANRAWSHEFASLGAS